jgi:LmbE family N-acetylglucosaminyl deacetylase
MRSPTRPIASLLFALAAHRAPLVAQSASAAELSRLVQGLTVTPRVLVIGMHPDDEDSRLIAWLSRGRNVETAYLSVTRGEAAQDFGGEAAGSLVGGVRTQELLAARRIDGAHQYFTRAYDFGFARVKY